LPQPIPVTQVIVNASIEVRSAVVYATFIVVLVFMPVLALSGVAGKLFAPLALAYILAILMSLVVALTVTPALAYAMLHRMRFATEDPWLIRKLKAGYASVITRFERRTNTVIATAALLCVGALAVLPFFSVRFLPELREGHYIVQLRGIPGMSLNEALRLGGEVTAALRELPGVRSVSQRAGRAEKWIDTTGLHISEFDVDLNPSSGEEQKRLLDQIRQTLSRFPGVGFTVWTYLTERIDETISGYTAQVIVNIFGNDLDVLDVKATEIAKILSRIPGATGVQMQSPQGTPQLVIRLRPQQLARWGFTRLDVLDSIEAAYEGAIVGQVYEGNRVFDVSVLLNAASRMNPTEVGALPMQTPDGLMVPLNEIADIYLASGRYNPAQRSATRAYCYHQCGGAGGDWIRRGSAKADKWRSIVSQGLLHSVRRRG
jgi:Cu/Ag efflux pump CusA